MTSNALIKVNLNFKKLKGKEIAIIAIGVIIIII